MVKHEIYCKAKSFVVHLLLMKLKKIKRTESRSIGKYCTVERGEANRNRGAVSYYRGIHIEALSP